MRWGKNTEATARQAYLEYKTSCGRPDEYRASGLHLYPLATYLGASSDGIVVDSHEDDCCIGCLEIKCPFSMDGNSVTDLSPAELARRFKQFC